MTRDSVCCHDRPASAKFSAAKTMRSAASREKWGTGSQRLITDMSPSSKSSPCLGEGRGRKKVCPCTLPFEL